MGFGDVVRVVLVFGLDVVEYYFLLWCGDVVVEEVVEYVYF